jgi:WD40 repeat protein
VLAGTWSHLEGLPSVSSVESSVLDLASVLRAWAAVPEQNLRLVLDPRSPLDLGTAIAESAATATDSLLVYYAGHGLVGPDGGLYLATRSTENLTDGLQYTALPYAALRESVMGSRARAVAVILDCCFSGRPHGPLGPAPLGPVFEQAAVRGGYLLAATAREERGLAAPNAKHTAFTGALIRLLLKGDRNLPELLTLDHIYRYLVRVLPEEEAPRPHRQASDEAGDLVLAPNPGYRRPPAPAEEPPVDGPCPFRGMDSFRPVDSEYFFGRERLAADVVDRVMSRRGMIAVVGASGCGKTSLLRAGVVPELEFRGWNAAYLTPGPDPAAALDRGVTALAADGRPAVLLVDQFEELFSSDAAEGERQRFVTDLAEIADSGTPVIIAVRSDFYQACIQYALLARVLEDRQVIVTPMTSRELKSAIEKPAEKAGLRLEDGLTRTLLNEARVRRDGEQSAVLPFLQYALLATWERRSGSTLTLAGYQAAGRIGGAVEHAAEEAWEEMLAAGIAEEQIRTVLLKLIRLGEGTQDTRRRVLVAELAHGYELGSVRRMLDILTKARLVTVDDDSAELAHETLLYAWPQLRDWIKEDRDALLAVQRLSDAARTWDQAGRKDEDLYRGNRLDTALQAAGLARVTRAAREQAPGRAGNQAGIARHAAARSGLARVLTVLGPGGARPLGFWPGTRVAASLNAVRTFWRRGGYPGRLTRPGQALDGQLENRRGPDLALDPLARAFLGASQRTSRRRSRRRRAGLAMICTLVLAAAVIGAYSVREQQDNAQHTATVNSTQLAGDADALRATDPGLAAQLAVAAYRYAPTEQASTELYDSLNTPLDTVIGTDGSYVTRVAAEADGPLAAAVSLNGLLRVWNLSSPSTPVLDATIQAVSGAIALSPHGGLLAGACPGSDPGLCLWNLANPRHPVLTGSWRSPAGAKLRISAMAISPDGKMLAGASLLGFTLIWSIGDPSHPRLIADLPDPTSRTDGSSLAGVAFASGGHLLAETILGGATRLWSIADPTRPALVSTIQQGYASIAFDPLSSLLAAVGDENAGLWQVADPRHPEQLKIDDPNTGGDMAAVAFSPDGENVTLTELDTNDTRGELCTLRIPDELILGGHVPWVCTGTGVQSETESYNNAGALLTGGTDGLVRSWRWPGRPAEGILDGSLAPEQVSPDGQLMATVVPRDAVQAANLADDAGSAAPVSIDIWSVAAPAAPVLDAAIPVGDISLVQFLPANVLLIADGKGRTRLWDLRNPRHPVPAASLGTAGISAAETAGSNIFGESANHIVGIEDPDGRLHLWRITSAEDAVQVGSIPGTPGETGILDDGQTAYRVTGSKIQWWDISNPAHPVRRGSSALPGSGSLDTATAAGTFLVATTTVDLSKSGNSDLVLFDVVRGRVRSTATLSTTVGRWLQVSPASHLLAVAGGGDNAVTLWDIADPAHPQRLSIVPAQLGVLDIEFSPDGKVLALSTGATVQLWDIHNPEEPELLGSITTPAEGDAVTNVTADEEVLGMAFTGQGDTLATATTSMSTSLVDSDPAQLAARLCGYAAAPINSAQWQQDAPGVPYQRPCP